MASEGPNSPGTMADDAAVGDHAWTNVNNAKASDDSYASPTDLHQNDTTHYLKATNFGFSIPGGATIDGIVVEIERHAPSVGAIFDEKVSLVVGGAVTGDDKSDGGAWATADPDNYVSYGGSSDGWGVLLTAAQVNASDFGIVLQATNIAPFNFPPFVDHIRITVYYTPALAKDFAFTT